MDAQRTAHDQPDDDGGAFAAIVARIDLADADESTTAPVVENQPITEQAPDSSAPIDQSSAGPVEPAPEAGSAAADEPELVVPPEPEPETSKITTRAASAFAHLVWLAVAAGLFGQIVGWSAMFGQNVASYLISATLGATFEFVMVAASSRGLVDIGRNRDSWQPVVFLAIGTACAAMAVWMILTHFNAPLPQFGLSAHDARSIGWAAAACAALGYVAHIVVHLPDELANRTAQKEWRAEAKRVQREIDERNRRRLADRDEFERRQMAAQLAAATPQQPTASQPDPDSEPESASRPVKAKPAAKSKAKSPTKGRAFDQNTARERLGGEFDRLGPAEINRRMAALGYDTVNPSTIRRWRR